MMYGAVAAADTEAVGGSNRLRDIGFCQAYGFGRIVRARKKRRQG